MAFKVYTKTGDKGTTALIGGVRVPKYDARIEAYGTVDELNSYIGLLKDAIGEADEQDILQEIQDRLFTIGSILATPAEKVIKMQLPDLLPSDIAYLEKAIDTMEEVLPAMQSFVLPGGHIVSSYAHIARCVCRRAERLAAALSDIDHSEPLALTLQYLNRLSDYLFVLSRYILHENGIKDIPWRPRLNS